MNPFHTGYRRPALLGILSAALGAWTLSAPAAGQSCLPVPVPQTHAPIGGFDQHTIALGQFENTSSIQTGDGLGEIKATHGMANEAGLFGTDALRIFSDTVGIYPLPAFATQSGSLEFWFKPGADTTSRQVLFSLRGAESLNGDRFTDLVMGEASMSSSSSDPGTSRIYFGSPAGLKLNNPARFATVAPRGLSYADIDGNGKSDLIVSDNYGDTLSNPITSTPGELHVYYGSFHPEQVLPTPDVVVELDLPQGMVVADVNEDGAPDITAASFHFGTVALWGFTNDGSGNFTPTYGPVGPEFITSAEGVAAGDVNRDGLLDFIYGSFSMANSYVLYGQLDEGVYSLPTLTAVARSEQTLGVDFGDVNGDGWIDSVLAQPLYDNGPGIPSGRIAVHLNDGAGGFSSSPDMTIMTPRPFTVLAGKDINNDSHIDIVVANWRNGPTTIDHSTVFLGPIMGDPEPSAQLTFLVDNAVSMAIGDYDANGIDDIFFHSSTANQSPVFLLDQNGMGTAGSSPGGHFLPNYTIPSEPTLNNPAGEGVGVMAANVGGTTAYGTNHIQSNSFEIYVQDHQLHFEVYDQRNRSHSISAPLPTATHPDAQEGFHHLQAGWSPAAGLLEMRVGHPDKPENLFRLLEADPWNVRSVCTVFRLGTDSDNQYSAKGWLIDDLRISSVRRSELDFDRDGIQDGWDNCPNTPNSNQLDGDDDGLGDACTTCQPNLGFGGPGDMTISLCGQALCNGQTPDFQLLNGPLNSFGMLFVGLVSNPVSFKGGMLVPVPHLAAPPIQTDSSGRLGFPVPGGAGGLGSFTLYIQAAMSDQEQLAGVALSNVLKATFYD